MTRFATDRYQRAFRRSAWTILTLAVLMPVPAAAASTVITFDDLRRHSRDVWNLTPIGDVDRLREVSDSVSSEASIPAEGRTRFWRKAGAPLNVATNRSQKEGIRM